MILDIARNRLSAVIKPDSITATQGDFLATHVSLDRLELLDKFELDPHVDTYYSEEQVYKEYVLNPNNKHQFITIYGQSGTGKSHLIRWFEAKFQQDKSDDEVVLFIKRNDNTLKGTIRQLLDKPEVQGIANKDIYDRLTKASVSMSEEKLKDTIYHNFIVELKDEIRNSDDSEKNNIINRSTKKHLEAFLNNELIQQRMMSIYGPIERIYSKVADNDLVDPDIEAKFIKEDFLVTTDNFDRLEENGADSKAIKLAKKLMADDAEVLAENIACYLNQFVNDVIQKCAGIEPGDFRQIFHDIRKELFKLDKKLTLFIEDVTSFTGVDNALLDALVVEHTGMNSEDEICRISSIVGTTRNFLQNNFKDNHKDRITKYIYIPDDVFNEEKIFEFVGRYLNTMSLTPDEIDEWISNSSSAEDYPVHKNSEGDYWDYTQIDYNKKLCLYPFTKNSIRNLYRDALLVGHRTPRYIIKNIIEPVVNDILKDKRKFPSINFKMGTVKSELSFTVNSQVSGEEETNRIIRFLTIWGNGRAETYEKDGVEYISGLRKDIFKELDIPLISFAKSESPIDDEPEIIEYEYAKDNKPKLSAASKTDISADKKDRVNKANEVLTKWVNGGVIDISANNNVMGVLKRARENMCKYLFSVIDWQVEGISADNISKIKNANSKLIAFERQTKNNREFYVLPADWNSQSVISAFIKWQEYGNGSWNYSGSDFDAFLVTTWAFGVKDKIIEAVNTYSNEKSVNYIDAAISSEIYKMILFGEFTGKKLDDISTKLLFTGNSKYLKNNEHSKEWNNLITFMSQKNLTDTNINTVRNYFNIVQGDKSSSVYVIDDINLQKTFSKVKNDLLDPKVSGYEDDRVGERREICQFNENIRKRLDKVASSELNYAKSLVEPIFIAFDDDDIDEADIEELSNKIKMFYTEANNAQINILMPVDKCENVKTSYKQIAKAIEEINDVVNEKNTINILMAFSSDPILEVIKLKDLMETFYSDLEKAKKQVMSKKKSLGEILVEDDSARYKKEKQINIENFELFDKLR